MPELTVNLTTDRAPTAAIDIPAAATRLAVAVDHDDETYTWDTAVLTLQWTVDADRKEWVDFDPAITLGASARGLPRIPVAGVSAVRWRTSTPDASADPSAVMDYLIS